MASFAYQITNFAYQGSSVFVYQGTAGDVQPQVTGSNLRWKRKAPKRRKKQDVIEPIQPEIVLEIPTPELLPSGSLKQVLEEMEAAGFAVSEIEDEDDALLFTFVLKQ